MIEPVGGSFRTGPVTYFKILTYMEGGDSEFLWEPDGVTLTDEFGGNPGTGEFYTPNWFFESGPTLHGSFSSEDTFGPLFWVSYDGFNGTKIWQARRNSETGSYSNPSYTGAIDGGMDDLLIYRPTDLFVRKTAGDADPEHPLFGQTWERDDSSYLVTHQSGFMSPDVGAGREYPGTSQVWIHQLITAPTPSIIYAVGSDTVPIPPALLT